MTWYQKLISCIEVAGNGVVAVFLRSTVETGLFSLAPKINGLDTSVSADVSDWFHTRLKPWFSKITLKAGGVVGVEDLSSSEFISEVNDIITSLHVSRAYYAKVADETFITSLENVSRLKARFCEELAEAVQGSYEKALAQYGLVPQYQMEITEASSYEGITPEFFNWPGTIEAYHQIITDVAQEGQQQEQQERKNNVPQYLPWVFTAAFGLIAWSAAAKKQ